MKQQIVKVVSSIMLFVFFVGIAPKEYVHEVLFDHHDTVHPIYKKGEIVITEKHIHCAFLGFVLAHFISADHQQLSFTTHHTHAANYVLPAYHYQYSSSHPVTSLRGPPAPANSQVFISWL